ncbi:MAG: choice-of-anchor D domain-containing protein, partial [Candidatus Cloacimonetes bacterium]|nr:choice-of-anchor D domain-containing protein [Candidatus Cloacimonadota bacterium]
MKPKILILIIALMAVFSTVFGTTTVTIGTGTSTGRYPLNDYYVYSRSQCIYLGSEIGLPEGLITKVRWYRNDTGADPNAIGLTEVWLSNTTSETLSGTTWNDPGSFVASISNIDLGSGGAWVEIDIVDFEYTGGNLMVSVRTQNAPYTEPHSYWRYTSTSPSYRSLLGNSDTANPPALTTSYSRPNIQFDIEDIVSGNPPNPAFAPTPADGSLYVTIDQALSWASGGGSPVDYDVYFGITDPPPFLLNQAGTTYDPGELLYDQTYYWKIDPRNDNGYASDTNTLDVWSFTTLSPPLSGTKTIGAGGDFTTFTDAINSLNMNGIGDGGVIFNVTAGSEFYEEVPIITATGTEANPIVFQKDGEGANPVIKPTTSVAGIQILGGDWITFDGIDIMIASGQAVNYGYSIRAASATDGAKYNTIKNSSVTLNKANTSTRGIYQHYNVSPTNVSGVNSDNKFQNLTIDNCTQGINLYGYYSVTYAGTNNEVSNCVIGTETADSMGGTASGYGIYAYYQSGAHIFNNVIRNITTTSSASYGIYLGTCYGDNLVYNNKVYNIKTTSTSSTSTQYGIYATLGTTLTNSVKIYNNMIWGLTSGYTGSGSSSYAVEGIYAGGATAANTYYVDFNSIRIAGPTSAYSAGVYFAGNTATNYLRNNAIANYTVGHSTYLHMGVYFSNATTIGAAGSVSDNNVIYIDNATNGYVVRGSSTNYATLEAWNTASTHDGNSRPTNPQFLSDTDLHISDSLPTPVESNGSFFGGELNWVLTDIDGNSRIAEKSEGPDIGAHEGDFQVEVECETPVAQATELVLIPGSTSIAGSFTASDAEAYIVFRHTDPDMGDSPVDGTYYSVGNTVGAGTVIALGSASTFNATGLTAETEYNFTIFAYNVSGLNAPKYLTAEPLLGSMMTLPAAPANPAAFTAVPASVSQIDLNTAANAASDNVMIAWNSANSFGTPSGIGYNVGDPITGGGTVIYMGPAGVFEHTGLEHSTTYYYKAWSYFTAERTTYYGFSTGMTANATTPTPPVSIPHSEDFESIEAAGSFPAGWTRLGTKWSSQISAQSYNRAARSGTDYLYATWGASTSDWMFSRGMTLEDAKAYIFSIWYNTDELTGWNSFKMYIGSSATAGAMTTEIASVLSPINAVYTQLSSNAWSPTADGVYYIGLQVLASSAPYYMSFDDFLAEEAPPEPIFAVTPASNAFDPQQIGISSAAQTFTVSNNGGGELIINPAVTLEGEDADQFILVDNNEYPVTLGVGGFMTFTVAFHPTSVGDKAANLKIVDNLEAKGLSLTRSHPNSPKADNSVALTGTGFDAMVRSFPWIETFSTVPPQYWDRYTGILAESTELTQYISESWTSYSQWNIGNFANVPANGAGARVNLYGTACKYWLMTPPFDLGTGSNLELGFNLAFTSYSGTTPGLTGADDKFAALISTDGGATWSSANTLALWDNAGSARVLNNVSNTGEYVALDLSAYSGVVKFAFYGESTVNNADNYMHIDNVKIVQQNTQVGEGTATGGEVTINIPEITDTYNNEPITPSVAIESLTDPTATVTVIAGYGEEALPNAGLNLTFSGTNFAGATITINHNLGFVPTQIAYKIVPGDWNILTSGSPNIL